VIKDRWFRSKSMVKLGLKNIQHRILQLFISCKPLIVLGSSTHIPIFHILQTDLDIFRHYQPRDPIFPGEVVDLASEVADYNLGRDHPPAIPDHPAITLDYPSTILDHQSSPYPSKLDHSPGRYKGSKQPFAYSSTIHLPSTSGPGKSDHE
jgi:hypothetical protein